MVFLVSRFRELLGVAWAGLTARWSRTLLIMLGPVVGVAAMVAAVGLTESAKGDLQAKLSKLGTTLIIADAGGSFGQRNPTMPDDAVARAQRVPAVEAASAVTGLNGVVALPTEASKDYYAAFPVPVQAADNALPDVLRVPLQSGRWLNDADLDNHTYSAVLGSSLAHKYGLIPGEIRTVRLNTVNFGVVGVLAPVALAPELDNAVFITQWAAKNDFGTEGKPSRLYLRAREGSTQAAADNLPKAINLGGPEAVTTKVPSDALAASAQADKTLQRVALFAGLLALFVGGLGIANVMSISVIQRSSEIGIRRALGHTRARVGGQFLLEALFVGVLGGLVGAGVGIGVVYGVSALQNWTVVIDYARIPTWIGLAVGVSVAAGLMPSAKAARLEPLETLRLG